MIEIREGKCRWCGEEKRVALLVWVDRRMEYRFAWVCIDCLKAARADPEERKRRDEDGDSA